MKQELSLNLDAVLKITKLSAKIYKKMDSHLCAHGISYTDFMILYYLNQAPAQKMRRIDLADMMGMTASGVTRMLAPMEKIGLVDREANERDARVSYVVLAKAGSNILKDAMNTADFSAEALLGSLKPKQAEVLQQLLLEVL